MKAFALCAGLLLLLGAVSAASYEFGSKVRTGDVDEGRLVRDVNLTVWWLETGTVAGITPDPTDVAYLHLWTPPGTAPQIVRPGDIRITPYLGHPAGSRVKFGDSDLSRPLLFFPGFWSFLNLFGSPWRDIDDPVYFQLFPPPPPRLLFVADLRVSKYQGLNPGSWVKDGDADLSKTTTAMPPPKIVFYDQGGTNVYDDSDPVYLMNNTTNAPFWPWHITPGDLRLTAINGQN